MNAQMRQVKQSGYSILEVLIAIVIFSIGMLALASLQGSLTRATAEANLRTIATNLAERTIEDMRGFGRIDTDPAGVINAYNDIVDQSASSVTVGGVTLTTTTEVTDYYYDSANDTYTYTQPSGIAVSDFKLVTITVSWGGNAGYQVDQSSVITAADIDAGEVSLSAFISSVSTQGSGRTVTQVEDNTFNPFINYTPGSNPEIVSLDLNNNKFKESLTPAPEVIRDSELVETRFDVVTYSQSNGSALFLRREEFIAVSCECEMYVDSSGDATGRRPIVWAGDEYIEPEWVSKPYGLSANSQQSTFCTTCCQDHHDGGTIDTGTDTATQYYDPFRPATEYYATGSLIGDHHHYSRDRRGNLSLLTTACTPGTSNCTSTYVEACRLVRKDGFFRVAQDFRQEGINVFPYDYLDQSGEIADYSAYVTGGIETMVGSMTNGYESSPPSLTPPGRGDADSDLTSDTTNLPTALGADFQQLRSRGIYLDYLSDDLRTVIDCLELGGSVDTCQQGDVILDKTGSSNILELIPFFEVQLTFLNRWTEDPIDDPVDTTNEALESDNAHSRGVASRVQTSGDAMVYATGHPGVLGFTDTDPIDLNFASDLTENEIHVVINTENPPPPSGTLISGTISSGVPGVQASAIEIEATDASCNRTPSGFTCLVTGGSPTLKIFNYKKAGKIIVGCSSNLTRTTSDSSAAAPFAIFSLSGVMSGVEYVIWIEETSCTSPT